jgi:GT2 family glycosyltransferase
MYLPRAPKHDLAIIVISTNEAHWLQPCLSTVFEHIGQASAEVIVVDNQSTDNTRELVESLFADARVITSYNRGFGHANNRGWECADARYALFLNPDTEIVEGTFSKLVEALDARPEVGLAGVRHLTPDGDVYPTIRRFPNAARALGEALLSERWPIHPAWSGERVLDRRVYGEEQECDWTLGAFMIARREALLSAGLMDERYFLQSEEPDLCLRMKRAGWSVRHLPVMTIVHHADKIGRSPRMASQEVYARRQYAQKHFCAAHRAAYLSAIWARHAVRAIVPVPGTSPDGDADRRRASREALRTLRFSSEPPYCHPPQTALWLERRVGQGAQNSFGPTKASQRRTRVRSRLPRLVRHR